MRKAYPKTIHRGKTKSWNTVQIGTCQCIEVYILTDTGSHLRWRGGVSEAALRETTRSVEAMSGSIRGDGKVIVNIPVMGPDFLVETVDIAVSPEESHGVEGVVRTFIRDIRQM